MVLDADFALNCESVFFFLLLAPVMIRTYTCMSNSSAINSSGSSGLFADSFQVYFFPGLIPCAAFSSRERCMAAL